MSSPETINTRLVFPPNQMATDLSSMPEEAKYASVVAVRPEKITPEQFEQMDAYCQRVQQQLEEDTRLGRKRELV